MNRDQNLARICYCLDRRTGLMEKQRIARKSICFNTWGRSPISSPCPLFLFVQPLIKLEHDGSSSSHQGSSNNMGKRIQMVLVSPRPHLGLLLAKENVLVNHQELDKQRGGDAEGEGS
jgi:hypothetical protein